MKMAYDVIIIGGGPAGLSAALLLGRCRRRVLVVDANEPRNAASQGLHGFLTRDGVSPGALRAFGRGELETYPDVEFRMRKATSARKDGDSFVITLADGKVERCLRLLLATGRVDRLPDLPGFSRFYGRGVYHCPYCDGWENCGREFGVFGNGEPAVELAKELLTWSERVTLFSNGSPAWAGGEAVVSGTGISLVAHKVSHLEGDQRLRELCFIGGHPARSCDALFFCSACDQRSELPERLGCEFDSEDSIVCDGNQARSVGGLYIAGNVRGGVHLAITAAAEGAEAAIAINDDLLSSRHHSQPVGRV